jgi:hypothetical protein
MDLREFSFFGPVRAIFENSEIGLGYQGIAAPCNYLEQDSVRVFDGASEGLLF